MSTATRGWTTQRWMERLDVNKCLTQITIPGTHDSGALHGTNIAMDLIREDSWWKKVVGVVSFLPSQVYDVGIKLFSQCQSMTIDEQLNAGIRFLDIRVRNAGDQFLIFHGDVYQRQTFGEVLSVVSAFLKSSKETVVMSIKEDHTPDNPSLDFEARFDSYVAQDKGLWYLGDTAPVLGGVQGKIVLLRRFPAKSVKGINAMPRLWGDDAVFSISPPATYDPEIGAVSQKLDVQDYYGLLHSVDKKDAVLKLLSKAAEDLGKDTLYINFVSIIGPANPREAAFLLNYTLSKHLGKGRYGIVPLDFPGQGLIDQLIDSNF